MPTSEPKKSLFLIIAFVLIALLCLAAFLAYRMAQSTESLLGYFIGLIVTLLLFLIGLQRTAKRYLSLSWQKSTLNVRYRVPGQTASFDLKNDLGSWKLEEVNTGSSPYEEIVLDFGKKGKVAFSNLEQQNFEAFKKQLKKQFGKWKK